MKLYFAPGSCSLAPHIALREAELPVTYDRVTFGKARTVSDGRNYFDINPMGAVPALELDSGELLTENAALLQYIAAQAPAKQLAPTEGMARWHFLETLNFIATELHKGFSPLFGKPPEDYRAVLIEKLQGPHRSAGAKTRRQGVPDRRWLHRRRRVRLRHAHLGQAIPIRLHTLAQAVGVLRSGEGAAKRAGGAAGRRPDGLALATSR